MKGHFYLVNVGDNAGDGVVGDNAGNGVVTMLAMAVVGVRVVGDNTNNGGGTETTWSEF